MDRTVGETVDNTTGLAMDKLAEQLDDTKSCTIAQRQQSRNRTGGETRGGTLHGGSTKHFHNSIEDTMKQLENRVQELP